MRFEPGEVRRCPEADGGDVLSCARTEGSGYVVVSAAGEIDWATAPVLREQLASAMVADPPRIFLDLTDVTFLDSAGLSVLVRAHQQANGRGGWMALVIPSERRHVRKVLRMTSTDQVFPIYRTLAAALEHPDGMPEECSRQRASGADLGPANWLWPGYLPNQRADLN